MAGIDLFTDWAADPDVTQLRKISDAQALAKGWSDTKVASVWFPCEAVDNYNGLSLSLQHMTSIDRKLHTILTLISRFSVLPRLVRNPNTSCIFILASLVMMDADICRNAVRPLQISSRQRLRNAMKPTKVNVPRRSRNRKFPSNMTNTSSYARCIEMCGI